ncbi:DUF4124 domain-containing protein [Aliagarivorans taiwanensis]|uniref:DUF4124 domain-containing protein n=1 Tax=Aliagarivorans taiwanensis TaxID=561966 RepID=UPI0004153610|nr:DUF4124 domain-containing protein [Aliagarivorans taiwanensis]
MLRTIVSMGLLLILSAAADTVYQWTDEQGNLHYSDQPREGATQIDVDVTPPISEGPIAVPRPPTGSDAATIVQYQVSIVQPQDQQTLRDNQGTIIVRATTNPPAPSSLRYRLLLNGDPQGRLHENGQFRLTNVERGEHLLAVELVDTTGKKIASSQAITVYMHRATQQRPVIAPLGGG